MRLLLTGGSGRLGLELRPLLPDVYAPSSAEMDITNERQVQEVIGRYQPEVIVHAAAYTDVAGAERQRERCWAVNVEGTRHVAAAALMGARLIHISTDYVFSGQTGGYREDDPPGPTVNYYALTKLVAEEAARAAPQHLILRTSFRPRLFPYPVAYSDAYTSQDYVDVIAPMLAQVILTVGTITDRVLHVATERKSVYELARRRRPDVLPGLRHQSPVALPADVSLDTGRWEALSGRLP